MKKLTAIRHAKSSWSNSSITDFNRPLNDRGLRDAPLMANYYRNHAKTIDQIVSSSALRAKTTAVIFAKAFEIPEDVILMEERIYEASAEELFNIISGFKEEWNHVIMVGHNPGFSYLVGLLTSELSDKPTCCISEIELNVSDWRHVSSGVGQLVHYDFPKNYPEMQ